MSVTEIAAYMGSRVRNDIRVWAKGVEEAMKEDGADWGGTDMKEAGGPACECETLTCFHSVGRLKSAVSEAGVKSARVSLTGRYVLHKIQERQKQLGDCAGNKKLPEKYNSLKELLRRQGHEDSTDEVSCFV